jgi:hypothetical protein
MKGAPQSLVEHPFFWLARQTLDQMSRIAVFIDGAYLEFVLRHEFGAPRIDFELLVKRLSDGRDLLRTYYYDCLPFRSGTPTEEDALTT